MGKRKYDAETAEATKKSKSEENNENEVELQPQNESKLHENETTHSNFNVKHFRKELSGKQGQTIALTQFLQVCLNPDKDHDYLLEYLQAGGNSHEILRQIPQDHKKNLTLATPAFHLFHLIVLKVQSTAPHMIAITEEASRYFLNTFMPLVEIMISENSSPRHRKIILKLLTSMVTLNPDLGVEVLTQAPLTPTHLQYIVEKANYKESDNVRTAFVHFITSFLVEGHLPLVKALLEKRGLLALVIPGLINDEPEALLMFLNILKKSVIDNTMISKSLKLKTFSHQVLHNMFKVFSWKGPPEIDHELRKEAKIEITRLMTEIMLTLFTSHKLGLYFMDTSLGTSDLNKNQNLYKALLTLKRPWENEAQGEVILEVIYRCPDLHRALISIIEHSFEPQHSALWERTVAFISQLMDKLKPEDMLYKMSSLNKIQVASIIRFITLPVPLLKIIYNTLGQDRVISLYSVKVLVKMLSSLKMYFQLMEAETANVAELKSRLEAFFPKHLPAPSAIVALIDQQLKGDVDMDTTDGYKLPNIDNVAALLSLINLLLLYHEINPALLEGLDGMLDMNKVLHYSSSLQSGEAGLLQFKIVSLWAALDPSVMSIKSPLFKDLFLIMLQVYTNVDDTWIEAKDTLNKYFENTRIFEADEDEIHVMLYTLRHAKVEPVSVIADVVQYVLANNNSLLKSLRKRTLHLETADEDSQAKLEKLLDNLMEDKLTDDDGIIESRIPSTFVFGCIKYVTDNKETKEGLMHFLSVYVANLLHHNCSPEWTEAMIEKCDLEVKDYVKSWITPANGYPATSGDRVLKRIAKAVAKEGEELLEKALESVISTDPTDAIVWTNYLSFCIIRLAECGILTKAMLERIEKLWEAVLGNVRMRRRLLIRLIQRPRLLMLHTAVTPSAEEPSSVSLATKFLLDTLIQQPDIAFNSDLLRGYQMKNFQQISKILSQDLIKYDNAHTVRVLREIGVSQADDLRIIQRICKLNASTLIGKDGEISIALEILCVLLAKYSERADTELDVKAIKGVLKSYAGLLSTHSNDIQLAPLETVLTTLLRRHPPRIPLLSLKNFKLFFNIEAIRAPTAQLATTLLTYDEKLCKIYGQEVRRPEVLSRREITLPLGDALLEHRVAFTNKELLPLIWGEYKTKVMKLLEKPSKMGRVYEVNWRFIRKLLLECTVAEDCAKLFGKHHKFDSFEITHARLFHSLFLRSCLLEGLRKKEYLINYLMDMLTLLTTAIRQSVEVQVLSDMVEMLCEADRVTTEVTGFGVKEKDDFRKVTESAVWLNFCKTVFCTIFEGEKGREESRSKLLGLTTRLVKLLYGLSSEGAAQTFEALISHQGLSGLLLSSDEEARARLAELLYELALRSDTESSLLILSKQAPLLLSAYRARTRPSDRLILMLLRLLETRAPNGNLHLHLWGDAAARHYHVRENRTPTTLWGRSSPDVVLNLFDRDVLELTVRRFPITQELDYKYSMPPVVSEICVVSDASDNEGVLAAIVQEAVRDETKKVDSDLVDDEIYDPSFLLPTLSRGLSVDGTGGGRALRRGLLAVAVAALSSQCPRIRAAACHVLHLYCKHNAPDSHFSKNKNDKLLMSSFIDTLRRSLQSTLYRPEPNETGLRNPRMPAVCALFLARALMVSLSPSHALYKSVHNYLIAKERIDLTVVPDFLSLFHDGEAEAAEKRCWILDVISDGIKTFSDTEVVFKTMSLKMAMDVYNSALSDRKLKVGVFKTLGAAVRVPKAATVLVRGHGLIPWLKSALDSLVEKREFHGLLSAALVLFKNLVHSLNVDEAKTDRDVEFEIGLMLSNLLLNSDIFEEEDFVIFAETVNMLSKRTVKLLNENILTQLADASSVDKEVSIFIKRAVQFKDKKYLKSEFVTKNENNKTLTKELVNIVVKYVE